MARLTSPRCQRAALRQLQAVDAQHAGQRPHLDRASARADAGLDHAAGDAAAAIRICRHTLDMDPDFPAARRLLGASAVVGLSTHTPEQIAAAAAEPISYLAIGPVFGTQTKAIGYDAVGLERVRLAVTGAHGRPVVAIGGITLERAPSVIEAGASAVAVIGDLLATGNPEARVRQYLDRLSAIQPL